MMRLLPIAMILPALLLIPGCAAPPQAQRPVAPSSDLDFSRGMTYVVADLFTQLQRLPAFAPTATTKLEQAVGRVVGSNEAPKRSVIAVDVIVESTTGQQTSATERVESVLYERVRARFPQFDVIPLREDALKRSAYVVVATMTPVPREPGLHRLNMAMTETAGGLVVAQSGIRIRDQTLDTTPTALYRESPALVRDRILEGLARTAQTPAGGQADGVYFERLSTNALINDAHRAFNRGEYAKAVEHYEQAAKRPDGQQLRVYNGLYTSYWNLEQAGNAEKAFARIVALGLSTNNLAVKFLFRPGRTEFATEERISGPYPFWLRQIAAQLATSRNCLAVVGHSSRTGAEEYNDRLSHARADAIKVRLLAENPQLASRLNTSGMGFKENIIGAGTDDSRDALDRRVEFRVVACT